MLCCSKENYDDVRSANEYEMLCIQNVVQTSNSRCLERAHIQARIKLGRTSLKDLSSSLNVFNDFVSLITIVLPLSII